VTFDETIEASRKLDRHLKESIMPITDGEPLLSIKDLIDDIKAAKNEFRVGIHKELSGMASDIRSNGIAAIGKVREERKGIRDEFTGLLGNEITDTSDDTKSSG
jgi:hypothetical protein